ncbi:hypothetical protein A0H81_14994 [Grifola frondosa]|uniref:SAP domain-containing protein n=1 Tax=Grifola frondosa TaxID=5627 RepID=A0A1C7LM56_GRIFR|nr:hypothetical protein A0H81_14994 [Grifola frondosa]
MKWRTREGFPKNRERVAPIVEEPPTLNQAPSIIIDEKLEKAEKTLINTKSFNTLKNMRKDILIAMCNRRGLPVEGSKADLAVRLMNWRNSQNLSTGPGQAKRYFKVN